MNSSCIQINILQIDSIKTATQCHWIELNFKTIIFQISNCTSINVSKSGFFITNHEGSVEILDLFNVEHIIIGESNISINTMGNFGKKKKINLSASGKIHFYPGEFVLEEGDKFQFDIRSNGFPIIIPKLLRKHFSSEVKMQKFTLPI